MAPSVPAARDLDLRGSHNSPSQRYAADDGPDPRSVAMIPSSSMLPTLRVGQHILVNRLGTHPGVGAVVVFHPPAGSGAPLGTQCGNLHQGPGHHQPCDVPTRGESGQTFVKRVVGLPGDRLLIRDGAVYRNGVRETGAHIQPCSEQSSCTFSASITVPRGEDYMMGDNRGDSDDSRHWGPVPSLDHRDRVLHLVAAGPDRHLVSADVAAVSRAASAAFGPGGDV
jgi:signal peptidase I